jgi:hypothetical protein
VKLKVEDGVPENNGGNDSFVAKSQLKVSQQRKSTSTGQGSGTAEQSFNINVDQNNDEGTVEIQGRLIVEKILTAVVRDNDGFNEDNIHYQWQREIGAFLTNIGDDSREYQLTKQDEGAFVRVTVSYQDNQFFSNLASATTDNPVNSLPITQKTIVITDANDGMTVFDPDQIQQKLNIDDLAGYSLRSLSNEEMTRIDDALLPDHSNPNEPLDFNNRDIRTYAFYDEVYPLLRESSLFRIEGDSIILPTKPDLPKAFIGTSENKIPIGMNDSLGVFDSNGKIEGIINIRLAPESVAREICNNPTGEDKGMGAVIFVHGFNAQPEATWIPAQYWNNIPEALAEIGAKVYVPKLAPWMPTNIRTQQLIEYTRCVQEKTGVSQVVVFGHSQGAPSVRQLSYWMKKHDGYNPPNGNTVIQSAISIAGINHGGNIIVADKQHQQYMLEKFGLLYQLSMMMRITPGDLLKILTDLIETENPLNDPNTPFGIQYRLVKDITNDLGGSDGLLNFTDASLSGFIVTLKALRNYIYGWEALKSDIEGWEKFAYFMSLAGDPLNILQFRSGSWPGPSYEESYLYRSIDHIFDGFKWVEGSSGYLVHLLSQIKSEVNTIKSLLSLMHNELENLPNPNTNIDLYALTDNGDKVQQAIGRMMPVLPVLQAELHDKFIPALSNLQSALKRYRDLEHQPWYRGDIFKWVFNAAGDLFLGLDAAEVEALEGVIQGFIEIVEELVSLLDRLIQIDSANLMKALTSNNETERERAVSTIASLINDSESFLKNFQGTINFHRITLVRLTPRWKFTDRPLTEVSNALDIVETSMSHAISLIDRIKLRLRVALGDADADWASFLNWQLGHLAQIKEQLISLFLQTDAAVKHNINWNNLSSCILNNQPLIEYFDNQKRNRESNSDYPIALPSDTDLTPECAVVISNLFNASIDLAMPMDSINPRTGVLRTEDVKRGLNAVRYSTSQHINLQYPNTGLTGIDYNDCLANPVFSSDYYPNRGSGTKFYSLIAAKNSRELSPIDKTIENIMVSANNPSSDDRIEGPAQFMAETVMTRRQGGTNPAGDLSSTQIYSQFKNSDMIVKTCAQMLGQALGLGGDNTLNLNHLQITNNSLSFLLSHPFFKLLFGKETEGYASTQGELDQCNQSNTITQRKDCLHDLFPRIMIMFLVGLIIDYEIGNGSSIQTFFDTLKILLGPGFNLGEVEYIDVSEIYKQILEQVQSQ